jgi:hypothetical protein
MLMISDLTHQHKVPKKLDLEATPAMLLPPCRIAGIDAELASSPPREGMC